MRVFGLIGYPLSHSYSADYFNSKFRSLGLKDHIYKIFQIENMSEFKNLLQFEPEIEGLNVTIPYKEQVLPFVNELSSEATEIGAINCIKIHERKFTGYNTDCFGFEKAYIETIIGNSSPALIIGNGGASKAVQYVLRMHGIDFMVVSRTTSDLTINYQEISQEIFKNHQTIINTTPLGTFPAIGNLPPVPYQYLTSSHILIDLIYNPEITSFMKQGLIKNCKVFNGLSMLHHQAEESWKIWKG
jgi:shikimate dehydrogenase